MSALKRFLAFFAALGGVLFLVAGFTSILAVAGFAYGIPFVFLLLMVYGWMLFAFLHYRQARQEEVLQLLSTAAESQAPLAPALWAYLRDRPHGVLREFWVALLLFFVMPGYYWVWHRRHGFDSKVARVAYFLEMGTSLPHALQATPGVVPREAVFAVLVGEHTGKLSTCLRASLPKSLGPIWLELLPRLLYPLMILAFLSSLMGFWTVVLLPRIQKIFAEFETELPAVTKRLAELGTLGNQYVVVAGVVAAEALLFAAFLFASSTLRWYVPGVSRLYRRYVQAYVLKMLAVLLEAGTPAPTALGWLADSGCFAPAVRRRLCAAERCVSQGETMAEGLGRGGLLPAALVPLVQAAERIRNLPWALGELGETLGDRTVRALRRLSQALTPLMVALLGGVVAFVVIGMFMPLIELLVKLGEQ